MTKLIQVFKVFEEPNQCDAGTQLGIQKMSSVNVCRCQNEVLEKGKPVRIAFHMLDAESVKLYSRLNGVGWSWQDFYGCEMKVVHYVK
jgi:hypothetical protein